MTIGIDEVDGKRRDYDDDDFFDDRDGNDVEGSSGERPGDKRHNMVDNPLDRRALLSLEKQLLLEPPESKYDISVRPKSNNEIRL